YNVEAIPDEGNVATIVPETVSANVPMIVVPLTNEPDESDSSAENTLPDLNDPVVVKGTSALFVKTKGEPYIVPVEIVCEKVLLKEKIRRAKICALMQILIAIIMMPVKNYFNKHRSYFIYMLIVKAMDLNRAGSNTDHRLEAISTVAFFDNRLRSIKIQL